MESKCVRENEENKNKGFLTILQFFLRNTKLTSISSICDTSLVLQLQIVLFLEMLFLFLLKPKTEYLKF